MFLRYIRPITRLYNLGLIEACPFPTTSVYFPTISYRGCFSKRQNSGYLKDHVRKWFDVGDKRFFFDLMENNATGDLFIILGENNIITKKSRNIYLSIHEGRLIVKQIRTVLNWLNKNEVNLDRYRMVIRGRNLIYQKIFETQDSRYGIELEPYANFQRSMGRSGISCVITSEKKDDPDKRSLLIINALGLTYFEQALLETIRESYTRKNLYQTLLENQFTMLEKRFYVALIQGPGHLFIAVNEHHRQTRKSNKLVISIEGARLLIEHIKSAQKWINEHEKELDATQASMDSLYRVPFEAKGRSFELELFKLRDKGYNSRDSPLATVFCEVSVITGTFKRNVMTILSPGLPNLEKFLQIAIDEYDNVYKSELNSSAEPKELEEGSDLAKF